MRRRTQDLVKLDAQFTTEQQGYVAASAGMDENIIERLLQVFTGVIVPPSRE